MKVISIMDPYASLIAWELKNFETRSWATKYRGPIAIHASKKNPMLTFRSLPHDIQKSIFDGFYEKLGIHSGAMESMKPGCIIATANLTECFLIKRDVIGGLVLLEAESRRTHFDTMEKEFSFGDYTSGRFAWELSNVKRIEPIPAKGQLGIWNYKE